MAGRLSSEIRKRREDQAMIRARQCNGLFTTAIKWTHRRQVIHDCGKPGFGFRLQAAVPGRRNKVAQIGVTKGPQSPHNGF